MNTTLRIKIHVPAVGGAAPAARTGGSTDPREFRAMRLRQQRARRRVRRIKLTAMAFLVAAAAGAWVEKPRWFDPAPAVAFAEPAPAPVLQTPVPAEDGAKLMSTVVEPPSAAPCEDSFSRGDWRVAIETCGKLFEATPSAPLALRVAHAYFSHGDAASAGRWASSAVSLGTTDPDAYVLIGHAEKQAGHPRAAMAAYRRYLRLAPRGWHAARVRSALRELAPVAAETEAAVVTVE
jgi:Flp pilus assembly protein TadD